MIYLGLICYGDSNGHLKKDIILSVILKRMRDNLFYLKNSFQRCVLLGFFPYFPNETRENLRQCLEQMLRKMESEDIMLFNKYEMVLLWDLPDGPDTFSLTNSVMLIACDIKFWRITVFSIVQFLRGMFKGDSKGKRKY